jgi:pimeloyl-ACP methyl ester carboxylesterase
LKKRVPPADYACFAEPGRLEAFAKSMAGALQQGPRGAALDLGLYVREFDFRPGDVRVPITWFHGEQDTNSPIALARRAVAELPRAKLITYSNDAHLSVLCNHTAEIAQAMLQASPS